jgi:hypothetical protein
MRKEMWGNRLFAVIGIQAARSIALCLCWLLNTDLFAQDETPPVPDKGVQITFLPPPMEGTLSLGVYTIDGKLVRVLKREATEKDFVVGLNGFITHWDGKDDAEKPLAPGKYFVRGYAVGELDIEGVGYFGNDWIVDEDSPRVSEFGEMKIARRELLIATLNGGKQTGVMHHDLDTGKLTFEPHEADAAAELPMQAKGVGETTWAIAKDGEKPVVIQRSAAGESLRELVPAPGGPLPVSIAAALDRDEIFLAERDDKQFRVRGLRLKETTSAADGKKRSNWEVFFSKVAWKSDTYAAVAPLVERTPPFSPAEKVHVKLVPNPLLQVAPAALNLSVAVDDTGSFLQSADGLPLRRVTDTANLLWAVIGPAGKTLTLFQSDGAVVEEFRIGKLGNIMAFDAGEYELKP